MERIENLITFRDQLALLSMHRRIHNNASALRIYRTLSRKHGFVYCELGTGPRHHVWAADVKLVRVSPNSHTHGYSAIGENPLIVLCYGCYNVARGSYSVYRGFVKQVDNDLLKAEKEQIEKLLEIHKKIGKGSSVWLNRYLICTHKRRYILYRSAN